MSRVCEKCYPEKEKIAPSLDEGYEIFFSVGEKKIGLLWWRRRDKGENGNKVLRVGEESKGIWDKLESRSG